MKKTIFLGLIIALIIGSCTQEKKSPVEGAWKLVSAKWSSYDQTFPAQIQGSDIKIWSKEYFTFAGQFKLDTMLVDSYGWGTYTLNGDKYEEKIVLHADKPSIGKTIRMSLEVQNDTLIQKWPVDENWKLPEKYSTEKYVRVK